MNTAKQTKRTYLGILLAIVTATSIAACSKPAPPRAEITAEAKDMFTSRCAACHGADGRGNGPASASLTPKPRNYTDVTWQKSVTDEQIKKTITMGGAAVGKSPIMPASPDIEQNPVMLEGLVSIVRKFGE